MFHITYILNIHVFSISRSFPRAHKSQTQNDKVVGEITAILFYHISARSGETLEKY